MGGGYICGGGRCEIEKYTNFKPTNVEGWNTWQRIKKVAKENGFVSASVPFAGAKTAKNWFGFRSSKPSREALLQQYDDFSNRHDRGNFFVTSVNGLDGMETGYGSSGSGGEDSDAELEELLGGT